jgi:hypothetical protein
MVSLVDMVWIADRDDTLRCRALRQLQGLDGHLPVEVGCLRGELSALVLRAQQDYKPWEQKPVAEAVGLQSVDLVELESAGEVVVGH